MSRRGISLIEVLVAIGIVGLLIAITLPAVQWSRESARRLQCASHLKQLGLAITNYESDYGMYPHGLVHKYQILPYIDQATVYNSIPALDRRNPYARWIPIREVIIPLYLCPTDPEPARSFGADSYAATSYAACFGSGGQKYGFNGMFNLGRNMPPYLGGPVRAADVVNGLSNTVAMSEILHSSVGTVKERMRVNWELAEPMQGPDQLDAFADVCDSIPPSPADYGWQGLSHRGSPWWNGVNGIGMYNHILTPNRPSCVNGNEHLGAATASSLHQLGVNTLFGDGHVAFTPNAIDREVWRKMGSRVNSNLGTMP